MEKRVLVTVLILYNAQAHGQSSDLCPDIPGSHCTADVSSTAHPAPAPALIFVVTPAQVKVNLTETVAMRCSVQATGGLRRVISMSVKRGSGERVATVTATDAPTALADAGNLDVKGSVSALSGDGILELAWSDASLVATGRYECDVTAVNTGGLTVTLTQVLQLTEVTPSINDVIASMNMKDMQLQKLFDNQQQKIGQQNQKIENQQQQIDSQLQESITQKEMLNKQQQLIKSQSALLSQQQTQINNQAAVTTQLKQQLEACLAPAVAFTVVIDAGFTNTRLVLNGNQVVKFDKIVTNLGGGYRRDTGEFVCHSDGVYVFGVSTLTYNGWYACWELQLNSQEVVTVNAWSTDRATSSSATATLRLRAGDVVRVWNRCRADLYAKGDSRHGNSFTGALVQRDGCRV